MADAEIELRLSELEARWRGDPSSRLFLQLAEAMRRSGRLNDAIRVLEEGLRSHPEAISGLVALGRCELDNGRPERAVESLEKAIERDPSQLVANKLLVEALIQTREPDRAASRLEIYRLINDRDEDIRSLAQRIAGLRPADGPHRTEVLPVANRETSPIGAAPASMREGSADGDSPFGSLNAGRVEPKAKILAFFAAEGVFPALALADERTSGTEADRAGEAARPGSPSSALAEERDEAPATPTFSMRYIGEEVEREARDAGSAFPARSSEATAEAERSVGLTARVADEDAILEPHGSATLAALYLRQGHLEEAEQQYRAVLRAKPGDATALAGLAEVERRQREAASNAEPAEETLGLTQRKVALLRRFLTRIRSLRSGGRYVS